MDFPEADIEKSPEEEKPGVQVQAGEICGGSSSEFTETERLDKEMVERWKSEADTVLIFTGLFTAVVSVSLVESYKWISPDPNDQTVALLNVAIDLLTQTSQQFYNNSHGIPVQSVVVKSTSPVFQLAWDVFCVNIFWFNSLVICLGCAIIATLIQQWARRYLARTQGRGTPAQRAHVRRLLTNGLTRFRANWVRQLLGMLLHFAIFLYCLGLIVFIFHISQNTDNNLASSAAAYLFFCFLIYAVFTILPFFFLNCPYSTPYTPITWRLYHLCMFVICLPILAVTYLPLALCGPSVLKIIKNKTYKHRHRFWHGRKRSIELYGEAADANTLPT